MYVGLKQPRGDGERYVTPARAAAKETRGLQDDCKGTQGFTGDYKGLQWVARVRFSGGYNTGGPSVR